MKLYRVVDGDNFDRDYPDEKFVGPPLPEESAKEVAAIINAWYTGRDESARRYFRVEPSDYKLVPGFEP